MSITEEYSSCNAIRPSTSYVGRTRYELHSLCYVNKTTGPITYDDA